MEIIDAIDLCDQTLHITFYFDADDNLKKTIRPKEATAMAVEWDCEDTLVDIGRDGKSKVHERLLGTLNPCFKASTSGEITSDSLRAKAD
jgi:hypothetical protein